MGKGLHTIGLLIGFAALAAASGDTDKKSDSKSETSSAAAKKDDKKADDKKADDKKAKAGADKCKTNVDGKFGGMIEKIANEHKEKTDLQKDGHKEAIKKEWAEKKYCGKVKGTVGDVEVGMAALFSISCEIPDGMGGAIVLEKIDGKRYSRAIVYMSEDRIKKDHTNTNKGSSLELDIAAFSADPGIAGALGTVCATLK